MLPVTPNVTSYTLPPPIVNTTVPGTSVAHVPYDNVAPSVSSAQIDNNTRGNSNAPAQSAPPPPPALTTETTGYTPLASFTSAPAAGLGAQATFIAQLAGQDLSPESKGVLVEYEKMVANSNVKYMPSEAFKPQMEVNSLFGRILQNEKAQQSQAQQIQQAQTQAQASEITAVSNSAPVVEARPVARSAKPQANAVEAEAESTSNDSAPASEVTYVAPPTPRYITAYQSTATRVEHFQGSVDPTTEIA